MAKFVSPFRFKVAKDHLIGRNGQLYTKNEVFLIYPEPVSEKEVKEMVLAFLRAQPGSENQDEDSVEVTSGDDNKIIYKIKSQGIFKIMFGIGDEPLAVKPPKPRPSPVIPPLISNEPQVKLKILNASNLGKYR